MAAELPEQDAASDKPKETARITAGTGGMASAIAVSGKPDAGALRPAAADAAVMRMQPAMRATPADAGSPSTGPAMDASTRNPDCKPGFYAGTFGGSIEVIGLPVSLVTGAVSADLVLDAAREHLLISDLLIAGVDQNGNTLTVELTGSVNCSTLQLESGRLHNGNYHTAAPRPGVDFPFTGTVAGVYSHDPPAISGMFSVEAEDSSLLGGSGNWDLVLTP